MHLLLCPNFAHCVLVIYEKQVCCGVANLNIAMCCKFIGHQNSTFSVGCAVEVVDFIVYLVVKTHAIHRHLVNNGLGNIHRHDFTPLAELIVFRSMNNKIVYQLALY